jgi:putative membrane protein
MKGFVIGTAITAIAFYVMTKVLPQYTGFDLVTYEGDLLGIVVISVIFGLVNGLIGPIVRMVALPLTVMTMGLVGFAINAGLLLLTAVIANTASFDLTVGDFPPDLLTADTIVAAIVGAAILSIVSSVVRMVVPD